MKKIIYYLIIILQRMLTIFPVDQHKVFAINYWGKGYGDNCKYVVEALHDIDANYHIVWPLKNNADKDVFPPSIKTVKYYSLSFFYNLATSGTWLSNVRLPWFFRKRNNQYYIQLWHGNSVLKRVEKDAGEALDSGYIKSAKHDSIIADLMISNGAWWTDLIRNAFWYNGEILECGTPRLKAIYCDKAANRMKVKKYLGIDEDTNLILYAPTFRADFKDTYYTLDYQNIKKVFTEKYGGKWVVGVRLHPNLIERGVRARGENIYELTSYPDMYELMAAADVIITDYSSIMFEAGFAGIKVILYAPDIEEYKKDRNFYFKFEELPFPLAETNSQIENIVNQWDQIKYDLNNKAFQKRLGIVEQGAGATCIAKEIKEHWG